MSIENDLSKLRELTTTISTIAQEAKVFGTEVEAQRVAMATSDALLHVLAALEDLNRRVEGMEAERRLR